ncbi:MAG: Gfo/Idh/MocA family oxidoreductase [Verrucomicrobiota bacterium]
MIRLVIIGLGHWGPNLAKAVATHPEALVVAGVEPSAERRAFIAKKLPDLTLYASLKECLNHHPLDAAIIATPASYHHEVALEAIENGLHLLIEKPLAGNQQEASEIVECASQNDRILMTGHIFLYNDSLRYCKSLAQSADFGSLRHVRSVRTNYGPFRKDVNALWDLAAHDISIFNYLFESFPINVSCTGHSLSGNSIQDMAQGSLVYANGMIGSFFVSWLDPIKIRQVTLVGEEQVALFDDMTPDTPVHLYQRKDTNGYSDSYESFRSLIEEQKETFPRPSNSTPLINECCEFIDCIIHNRAPHSDGAFGLSVVQILEALDESIGSGGKQIEIRSR